MDWSDLNRQKTEGEGAINLEYAICVGCSGTSVILQEDLPLAASGGQNALKWVRERIRSTECLGYLVTNENRMDGKDAKG